MQDGGALHIEMNQPNQRALVRLREMLLTNAELACRLASLEQQYDAQSDLLNIHKPL